MASIGSNGPKPGMKPSSLFLGGCVSYSVNSSPIAPSMRWWVRLRVLASPS